MERQIIKLGQKKRIALVGHDKRLITDYQPYRERQVIALAGGTQEESEDELKSASEPELAREPEIASESGPVFVRTA